MLGDTGFPSSPALVNLPHAAEWILENMRMMDWKINLRSRQFHGNVIHPPTQSQRTVAGLAAIAALAALLALPGHAQAASFACAKAATPVEKLICADAQLSSLDDKLAVAYKKAIEAIPDKEALQRGQQAWLQSRDACKDATCVKSSYERRLNAPASSWAARFELIKTPIPDEGYQYSDQPGGVCEAYENNLNSFAGEPYGMACGRKLNPALGFIRPTWEKLDLLKHAALLQEIEIFFKFPPFFGERVDAKRFLVALTEQQAKGLSLEVTRLDIDEDGKTDNLIRFGWTGGCDASNPMTFSNPSQRYLLVVDSALTKVDSRTRFIGARDDVFLYKGKVYSDIFYGDPYYLRQRDASIHLLVFFSKGAARICRFHYYNPNLTFNPKSN